MSELIFDVSVDEDGRLLAEGRGESIFTDGADWDDLKANIKEVVEAFYFDRPKPLVIKLHMVRDEVLAPA
ncbi:MAG: hypothetical protein ABI147_14000 [Acidobacteriaceae bacterium]